LNTLIDDLADTKDTYNETLDEKDAAILAFENLMGPALREGYWTPEEYNDYGE